MSFARKKYHYDTYFFFHHFFSFFDYDFLSFEIPNKTQIEAISESYMYIPYSPNHRILVRIRGGGEHILKGQSFFLTNFFP